MPHLPGGPAARIGSLELSSSAWSCSGGSNATPCQDSPSGICRNLPLLRQSPAGRDPDGADDRRVQGEPGSALANTLDAAQSIEVSRHRVDRRPRRSRGNRAAGESDARMAGWNADVSPDRFRNTACTASLEAMKSGLSGMVPANARSVSRSCGLWRSQADSQDTRWRSPWGSRTGRN